MYEFDIMLTVEDYIKFHKYCSNNSPNTARYNRTDRIYAWITIGIAVLAFLIQDVLPEFGRTLITVSATLFLVLLILRIINFITIQRFYKSKDDLKQHFDENSKMQFNDDDFIHITKTSLEKKKYVVIEKIYVNYGDVYIHTDRGDIYIISSHVFSNNEQRHDFLMFLNNKLQKG